MAKISCASFDGSQLKYTIKNDKNEEICEFNKYRIIAV